MMIRPSMQGLYFGAAGGFTAPRMDFGATFGLTSDGLGAPGGGVGNGPNNFGQMLTLALGGQLRPVTAAYMGMSGVRMQNASGQPPWAPAARAALLKQRPSLWCAFSKGHNDAILTVNPVGNSWYTDWEEETYYDYQAFLTYATSNNYFVVFGTIPSNVAGEDTWRAATWAKQQAYVESLMANDYRVRYMPVTNLLPPPDFSIDAAASYTHSDERQPKTLVPLFINLMADVLPIESVDQVCNRIKSSTYPGMGSSNLDPLTTLATTGGTVSGTGLSIGGDGFLPGGKTVTLTMQGVTAVASRIAKGDGSYKVRVTLDGTVTTAGKLMFGDTSNQARTASPGRYFRHGIRFKSTKGGFRNIGGDWGTFGSFMGTGSSLAANNLCGSNADPVQDTILWVLPQATWGNDTNFSAARRWAIWWPVGTVFNAATDYVEFDMPFTYEGSDRGIVPAAYIGDAIAIGGVNPFFGNNYRARLSGSYSAASGGTLRLETGMVQPEGLTNADFSRRCIYKGTAGDSAIDSGTLIHTYSNPASWSSALAGGLAAQGELLYAQYDLVDPISGVVTTVRSRPVNPDSLTVAA